MTKPIQSYALEKGYAYPCQLGLCSRGQLDFDKCNTHFFKLLRDRLPCNRNARQLLKTRCDLSRSTGPDHLHTTPYDVTALEGGERFALPIRRCPSHRQQGALQCLKHALADGLGKCSAFLNRRRAQQRAVLLLVFRQT